MKAYLFFLAASLAHTTVGLAQKISKKEVPTAVCATFTSRFPTVKAVSWEKESHPVKAAYEYETHNDFWAREAFLNQEEYEASFQLNGQQMSVVITPDGIVQETETEMTASQLPPSILALLARNFNACRISEAARIVKADGSILYEAEVALAGRKQDILFTADGLQTAE